MNGGVEVIQGDVTTWSPNFEFARLHSTQMMGASGRSPLPPQLQEGCRREMHVMVPRFSPLPFVSDAPATFTTTADKQSRVTIDVLEGELTLAEENRLLGTFVLSGLQQSTAGVPQVGIHFRIDHNGILHVAAKDSQTGSHADVKIRNMKSSALTEQMTGKMSASLEKLLASEP